MSLWGYVRRRPVTVTVALISVGIIVAMVFAGTEVLTDPLPVPNWISRLNYTINWVLSIISFALVWKRLHAFEDRWTWQELAFLRGVLMFVFGASLGYVSRAFSDQSITVGTPVAFVALLAIIYGCLDTPERFSAPQQQVVANADQIAALFAEIDHADPCPDPNCMRFRADIKRLMEKEMSDGSPRRPD